MEENALELLQKIGGSIGTYGRLAVMMCSNAYDGPMLDESVLFKRVKTLFGETGKLSPRTNLRKHLDYLVERGVLEQHNKNTRLYRSTYFGDVVRTIGTEFLFTLGEHALGPLDVLGQSRGGTDNRYEGPLIPMLALPYLYRKRGGVSVTDIGRHVKDEAAFLEPVSSYNVVSKRHIPRLERVGLVNVESKRHNRGKDRRSKRGNIYTTVTLTETGVPIAKLISDVHWFARDNHLDPISADLAKYGFVSLERMSRGEITLEKYGYNCSLL